MSPKHVALLGRNEYQKQTNIGTATRITCCDLFECKTGNKHRSTVADAVEIVVCGHIWRHKRQTRILKDG